MGNFTILAIPHDSLDSIARDFDSGKSFVDAIQERRNPNLSQFIPKAHGAQLGPMFHSNETLFVYIEDGVIKRLSAGEQNHITHSLARFRKKKIEQEEND